MVEISLIMPTARNDYPIIGLPELHMLEPTLNSLEEQTFRDFELIVVDRLYDRRSELFDGKPFKRENLGFPIKHVPVHPNHWFWIDRKRWAVCAALNTGILHAEGELLVRLDDCSQFDSDYLEKFWEGYQSGCFPLAMHTRYRGGKQAYYNEGYREGGYEFVRHAWETPEERRQILSRIYREGDRVRDTRWPVVERRGGRMTAPVNWMYGYSSFSLEAALRVNGFDERFDGQKSLEDVDFGSRLEMAGYRDAFALDVNLWVIEHEHQPIPPEVISPGVKPIVCNYALYLLNRRKRRWRANCDRLTDEDLRFIREESLKPPCSPKPNFYQDDCGGELFRLWATHQPVFNLREERLEVP